MYPERHVRLFRNGRNQALRIPREFELDAQEVVLRQEENRLVIEPVRKRGLLAVLADLPALSPDESIPDVDEGLSPADGVNL